MKNLTVHSSQIIQLTTIRLMLRIATMFDFEIWTADVRQAYLQSEDPLSQNIFIEDVAPEFERPTDQDVRLLKPLYGSSESGDLWFNTLDKNYKDELAMKTLRTDPALYVKRDGFKSMGVS